VADSTSLVASSPVSGADLERVESFAREPFVLEGEDPSTALADGTARRIAFDAAQRELDAGREEPSVEWRQDYSLILGLERLLSEDEPHLADGTVLSAHQVDALSGTLIALTAEVVPVHRAATAVGAGTTITFIGMFAVTPVFGSIADHTGSYSASWLALAGWSLLGTLIALAVRDRRFRARRPAAGEAA